MINLVQTITVSDLQLRQVDITEAATFNQFFDRNREYLRPWLPGAVQEPHTLEQRRKQLRDWKGSFYLDQKYMYGVYENSILIGVLYLFRRQGAGTLEIGYVIDQNQAGKGYATACAYALTRLGIEHLAAEKMYIICDPENKASARIPEKLGYELEVIERRPDKDESGKRKKDMKWVLFREDFQHLEKYEPVQFELEEGWDS